MMAKSDKSYVEANRGLPAETLVEDLGGRFTLKQVNAYLKKLGPVGPPPPAKPDAGIGRFAVHKGSVVMTEAQSMVGDEAARSNFGDKNPKYACSYFDPRKKNDG